MKERSACPLRGNTMPETDNQPTGLAQVLAYVDAHQQQFIDRLLAYVAQPSISAHGVGIRETADFLFSYLQDLGMETRLLGMEGEHAGWPFVYGRHRQRPQAPTALLYGHYDVQPPDPLDAWMSPPFEPEIRDGRIWGRGVGDNKGQHLAQLLAIESWLAVTGACPATSSSCSRARRKSAAPISATACAPTAPCSPTSTW